MTRLGVLIGIALLVTGFVEPVRRVRSSRTRSGQLRFQARARHRSITQESAHSIWRPASGSRQESTVARIPQTNVVRFTPTDEVKERLTRGTAAALPDLGSQPSAAVRLRSTAAETGR